MDGQEAYFEALIDGPTGPNWRQALLDHCQDGYKAMHKAWHGSTEWYAAAGNIRRAQELLAEFDRR